MMTMRPTSLALSLAVTLLTASLPPVAEAAVNNGRITLNFANADIESVVKAMSEMTGRTFIVDPRVKGTLNISTPKPVSSSVAYEILLATLRMQGFAAVEADGVVRVLPEADAKFYAAPGLYKGRKSKVSGTMATRVFVLKHESAVQLLSVLRPLVGGNSAISADASTNSIVLTDYADNLERMAGILESLDMPRADEPVLIPLRHAMATEVAGLLDKIFPSPAGGPAANNEVDRLNIAIDSRSNSLIVRGRDRSLVSRVQGMVASLDTPTSVAGNVHVLYLKNAEAVKMAETLRRILSADTSSPATPAATPASGTTPARSAGQTSSSAEAVGAGMVQADAASNALIITAPDAVFENIRAVVEQLDVRRAQVLVEALIAEVSADKAAEFGIQWAAASNGSGLQVGGLFGNSNVGTGGSNIGNLIAAASDGGTLQAASGLASGFNLALFNSQSLGALARALETDVNANILSTPTLLTLDNEEAKMSVGSNVPFKTGSATITGTATPYETIERKDIGLSLKVKPQISEGGTVRLQIVQEVSKLRTDSEDVTLAATDKRAIESTVLVDDGQIVVLGGLIEEQVQDVEDSVPLLGDIPVLGHLFRYNSRTHVKTNLMVFLRPVIVRTAADAARVTHSRYDYIKGLQTNASPEHKVMLPDVTAPVLKYDFDLGLTGQ